MNCAVVNGSLGTIGLALVKRLLDHGVQEVYAVVFPGDSRIERIPEGAVVVPCDMREISQLKELINEPVDVFFHLAWAGTIGESRDDMFLQTQNIQCAIEAAYTAKEIGAQVFVGVGSQAEHGRIEGKVTAVAPCFPINGYGMAKLCAGQMTRIVCKRLGVRHEWARVLSVFGANDGPLSVIQVLLNKLTEGEKPALTPGEQLWDYIYADDAADAMICMAESGKDGKVYPVGSGKVRPLREYFEILRDTIDPNLPLGIGELPYPPNQVMYLEADISELQEDTGFSPKYSFEDAAKIVVREFRERKGGNI
ncbi:MAG: NAD(P)-dependent oxidoreductase [Clostridia bacterium]|nr:NAD(P)-dependent oxidoreductase [Clostridia bacterium]